ncbi:hypothetical protein FOVSG1_014386 [Fusarium oxysporum f. sp. vasinfectum]
MIPIAGSMLRAFLSQRVLALTSWRGSSTLSLVISCRCLSLINLDQPTLAQRHDAPEPSATRGMNALDVIVT